MSTIKITEWLEQNKNKGFIELPNKSIADQLKIYDDSGTGIGFVLVLMITSFDESNDPNHIQYQVDSIPIIKMRNEWVTIKDESLADIVSGVIRAIAPEN